jgi:hypothetical protein
MGDSQDKVPSFTSPMARSAKARPRTMPASPLATLVLSLTWVVMAVTPQKIRPSTVKPAPNTTEPPTGRP